MLWPSLTAIVTTAQQLEYVFGKVKDKLLNNPTEASSKLAEAFGELALILEFVEKETVRYLEITFLPDKSNLIPCRSALLSLESGYVTVKGYEARGHCHKIKNIHTKYLQGWFSSVLDKDEATEVNRIFAGMYTGDDNMVQGIQDIAGWLKTEAKDALDLVDADQLDAANLRIRSARTDVLQTRREIVEGLAQMRLLQASFVATARTV